MNHFRRLFRIPTNLSRQTFLRAFSSSTPKWNKTALTAEVYDVKRGMYSQVDTTDVQYFRSILDENQIITDESELEAWNVDWLNTVRGQSQLMLKPRTTQEVSQILKYCNERKLAVCPQGGNTGLVGGSVPVFDEIILSTQLMNKIFSVDALTGVITCQAGCILENLNSELLKHNLQMPLDLGAKGSCHIGGNISTNAGGVRFLRYGSLKGSVLGLEVVLADGKIMDCLSTIRKDNTGYDLKQLFIGSEGTLGFVTGVSILTPVKSKSINVAFFGVQSFTDLLKIMSIAKESLGEIVSAIEFMDSECMRDITTQLGITNPISDHPFYFLVETSGSNPNHDEEKLNDFVEKCMNADLANDGTIATDLGKIQAIWDLRENIAEALKRKGYTYKYDISLPTPKMYDIVTQMRERLYNQPNCNVYGYGHLGDGNLHLNVVTPDFDPNVLSSIEPFVYEWTAGVRGSISAEHGLGFKKKNFINLNKSPPAVTAMQQIKDLFDPNHILNPYKTIPVGK